MLFPLFPISFENILTLRVMNLTLNDYPVFSSKKKNNVKIQQKKKRYFNSRDQIKEDSNFI